MQYGPYNRFTYVYVCIRIPNYNIYMKLYQRLNKSVIVHGFDFTYENSDSVNIKRVINSEVTGRSGH